MTSTRWADLAYDSDNEDDTLVYKGLPPTHRSRLDANGIQTVTSYRHVPDESQTPCLVKTTTKMKKVARKIRNSNAIEERKKWTKFGRAALDERAVVKSTIRSVEDVFVEDPNADTDLRDEDSTAAFRVSLGKFSNRLAMRRLNEKHARTFHSGDGPGSASSSQCGKAGGKYIPPPARNCADFEPQAYPKDLNSIRVTNLSAYATEADVQELFQPFGHISRVYVAKDKETHASRGFAFVSFISKEDAVRAMEKLQGYGYDHMILKLE